MSATTVTVTDQSNESLYFDRRIFSTCSKCGVEIGSTVGLEPKCAACRAPTRSWEQIQARRAELLGKPLSFRCQQIHDLLVEGLSHKQIAALLHLTTGTVKEYICCHIFPRLGVRTGPELVALEIRRLRERLSEYEAPTTRGSLDELNLHNKKQGRYKQPARTDRDSPLLRHAEHGC